MAAVIALLVACGAVRIVFTAQKLLGGVIQDQHLFYIRSPFNVAEKHSYYKQLRDPLLYWLGDLHELIR